ncbi:hypothetical protein CEXT_468031 [Caerostris extrusa]|uniref:Uncharacterized protein n=1 Tax=Caerostris extrusa TaxID=172846 RepID=A0AAV4XNW5_CAEEX|nr:hypothetical protein CEXT_468031 [Caerostris extrusa]
MIIRLFLYDPHHHLQADCDIVVTQKQRSLTHICKTRPPNCHGRQDPQYRLSLPETTDPLTPYLYHEDPLKACLTTFSDDHPFISPHHHLQVDCHIMVTQKLPSMTHIHKTRPPNCHGRQIPSISSVSPRDHRSIDITPLSIELPSQ